MDKHTDFVELEMMLELQDKLKELEQERDKYKSIVEDAIYCINDFLCTEEYCVVDGIAIADNYNDLLKILNGAEVKYFDRDKCFVIEVEKLEEGNSNEKMVSINE